MSLYQQGGCQFELKATDQVGLNGGRLSDFLDSYKTGQKIILLWVQAQFLKKSKSDAKVIQKSSELLFLPQAQEV